MLPMHYILKFTEQVGSFQHIKVYVDIVNIAQLHPIHISFNNFKTGLPASLVVMYEISKSVLFMVLEKQKKKINKITFPRHETALLHKSYLNYRRKSYYILRSKSSSFENINTVKPH